MSRIGAGNRHPAGGIGTDSADVLPALVLCRQCWYRRRCRQVPTGNSWCRHVPTGTIGAGGCAARYPPCRAALSEPNLQFRYIPKMAAVIGQAIEAHLVWWLRWWAYIMYGWQSRKRELMFSVCLPVILALAFAFVLALAAPAILTYLKKPRPVLPSINATSLASPSTNRALSTLQITLQVLGPLGGVILAVWRLSLLFKPISQRIAEYVFSPSTKHLANIGYQNSVIEDL
jgi:hypothetical protein